MFATGISCKHVKSNDIHDHSRPGHIVDYFAAMMMHRGGSRGSVRGGGGGRGGVCGFLTQLVFCGKKNYVLHPFLKKILDPPLMQPGSHRLEPHYNRLKQSGGCFETEVGGKFVQKMVLVVLTLKRPSY